MQKKSGISLIVLVVTIIVLAILATTIIIAVGGNDGNIISQGNAAVFKINIKNYQSELALYIASQIMYDSDYKVAELNANETSDPTIKEIIVSMRTEDVSKFDIVEGELRYIGGNASEANMASSIGLTVVDPGQIEYETAYAEGIANANTYGSVNDATGEYTVTSYVEAGNGVIAIPYGATSFKIMTYGENNTIMNGENITKVIIPGTVKTVSGIVLWTSSFTTVIMCDGVETITETVFDNARNTNCVYVPSSVKYFGTNTFAGDCDIYYAGTETEWEALLAASGNATVTADGATLTMHYNASASDLD